MSPHHSNSTEKLPLTGKRILITRPRDQAEELRELLLARGAEPMVFPTIQIVPPSDWSALDEAIDRIETYDQIIFTSVNGVRSFFRRFQTGEKNWHCLSQIKIVAIGPRTAAEVAEFGFQADTVPREFRAESVVEALREKGVIPGKRFLLPRAEKARDVLPQEINRLGGSCDVVIAYRTIPAEGNVVVIEGLLKKKEIDVITFTSSSTVENFVDLFPGNDFTGLLRDCVVASIGPITAKRAESLGITTQIMPREYTIPALVAAIEAYFLSPQKKKIFLEQG